MNRLYFLAKEGSQVVVPYRGDMYGLRELRLLGDLGQVLFTVSNRKLQTRLYKFISYNKL